MHSLYRIFHLVTSDFHVKLCKFILKHFSTHTHKQNTSMHDELAYNMYKELKLCDQHKKQHRKSIALVAAMRLKQHQPNESLEILSIYDDIDVSVRYVRMLAYTHLNQFERVFRLLEMTTANTATNRTIPKIPDHLVSIAIGSHQFDVANGLLIVCCCVFLNGCYPVYYYHSCKRSKEH